MSKEIMLVWAQRTNERLMAEQEAWTARDLLEKQQEEEEKKNRRVASLGNFLRSVGLELQFDQDFIRFGEYELRTSYSRYGRKFALAVFAPAPYDIPNAEWDEPQILAGEMADANIEIGGSEELAAWLLNPTTNFPPEPKPRAQAEVPAYIPPPPPPPSTAEHLLRLIRDIVSDQVDGRFERIENSIERLGSSIDDADSRAKKKIEDLRYRSNELQNEIDDVRHRR